MDLDRAVSRIVSLTLILTIAGAVFYFATAGWRGGCGFLLGGAISYVNFRWIKRTVYALGETGGGKPPRARVAVFLGLRYFVLGVSAYAIVRFTEISLKAALVGLFAPTGAVILEILIELIYART